MLTTTFSKSIYNTKFKNKIKNINHSRSLHSTLRLSAYKKFFGSTLERFLFVCCYCCCCFFFTGGLLFLSNLFMSVALHHIFSDPCRLPQALSSDPTTSRCLRLPCLYYTIFIKFFLFLVSYFLFTADVTDLRECLLPFDIFYLSLFPQISSTGFLGNHHLNLKWGRGIMLWLQL